MDKVESLIKKVAQINTKAIPETQLIQLQFLTKAIQIDELTTQSVKATQLLELITTKLSELSRHKSFTKILSVLQPVHFNLISQQIFKHPTVQKARLLSMTLKTNSLNKSQLTDYVINVIALKGAPEFALELKELFKLIDHEMYAKIYSEIDKFLKRSPETIIKMITLITDTTGFSSPYYKTYSSLLKSSYF
jgi:hypothetical protein